MDNVKRIKELKKGKYQVLFGIEKSTFEAMQCILESAYKEMRKKGGRKRKLSVLDMLIVMFAYYTGVVENFGLKHQISPQIYIKR